MKYLIAALLFSASLCLHAQTPDERIQAGNSFYENASFEEALSSYEAAMVEASGVNLYFNA